MVADLDPVLDPPVKGGLRRHPGDVAALADVGVHEADDVRDLESSPTTELLTSTNDPAWLVLSRVPERSQV